MDTSNSNMDIEYNKILANELVVSFNEKGVKSYFTFFGDSINSNDLVIKFKRIKSSKVRLSTFLKTLPNCNRFEIRQLSQFPMNEKNFLYTVLSLSTEHEDACKDFANEFTRKISKRIK